MSYKCESQIDEERHRKPDSDSSLSAICQQVDLISIECRIYLAIFSSSLSRGSTCKLRSYISCTSPADCMFLKM